MSSGIPLSKVDHPDMKLLLECSGMTLAGRESIAAYIPLILDDERNRVRQRLKNAFLSIIFDGTSHHGESLARLVDLDFTPSQLLVRFEMLKDPLDSKGLTASIVDVLSRCFGIPRGQVCGFMHDCASVNIAAARDGLLPHYNRGVDIPCLSHFLNNCGEKIMAPTADAFLSAWSSIVSRSMVARSIIKDIIKEDPKRLSMTRWYSWWEIANQVLLCWGFVPSIIAALDVAQVAIHGVEKLSSILAQNRQLLMVELAIIVDLASPLVKATYDLVRIA